MPAAGETARRTPVELTLDYTEDELARFDALLAQQDLATVKPAIWEGWPAFIGLGLAAAIGAAMLAIAGGIATVRSGAGIATLCFATYWIGITAPSLAAGLADRRRRKLAYDAFRAEWNGTRLLATQSGIWFRRDGVRSFAGRSTIGRVTCSDGLLLLHLGTGQPTMIPLRLLTAEQQASLVALTEKPAEIGAPLHPG